jgi:hypothetical protein
MKKTYLTKKYLTDEEMARLAHHTRLLKEYQSCASSLWYIVGQTENRIVASKKYQRQIGKFTKAAVFLTEFVYEEIAKHKEHIEEILPHKKMKKGLK